MQLPSLLVLTCVLTSVSAFIANAPAQSYRQPFICNSRVGPLFAGTIKEIQDDAKDRMAKSVDSMRVNLGSIRTGRANSAILDRVKVKYYGVDTPLNQMASISVSSGNNLLLCILFF